MSSVVCPNLGWDVVDRRDDLCYWGRQQAAVGIGCSGTCADAVPSSYNFVAVPPLFVIAEIGCV